jgi:hypothetical protein
MRIFRLVLSLVFIFLAIVLVVGFKFNIGGPVSKPVVKNSGTQNFTGRVSRILPSEENYILDLLDSEATSSTGRVTKTFIVKKESTASASVPDAFKTSFGDIRVGDRLRVSYSGDLVPLKIIAIENTSAKGETKQPAFFHGIVSSVSGNSLNIYTTEGSTYTVKIASTVLMGPMYEKVGGVERAGKLKPVSNFESLETWQEISVFYSRNDGEIIIPDSILTF